MNIPLVWTLLILACATFSGCADRHYVERGYRPAEIPFGRGDTISLKIVGRSRLIDSAGRRMDLTAAPYTLWIYFPFPADRSIVINSASVHYPNGGVREGLVLSTPELRTLSEGTLWFSEARDLQLRHEDLEIQLDFIVVEGTSETKHRLTAAMPAITTERQVSFGDWFRGL